MQHLSFCQHHRLPIFSDVGTRPTSFADVAPPGKVQSDPMPSRQRRCRRIRSEGLQTFWTGHEKATTGLSGLSFQSTFPLRIISSPSPTQAQCVSMFRFCFVRLQIARESWPPMSHAVVVWTRACQGSGLRPSRCLVGRSRSPKHTWCCRQDRRQNVLTSKAGPGAVWEHRCFQLGPLRTLLPKWCFRTALHSEPHSCRTRGPSVSRTNKALLREGDPSHLDRRR